METSGIMPTYNVGANGFGDSSFVWLFAILALMWGGNGGLFGNSNLGFRPSTAEDVNNGFNFNDLQNQNRDILGAISSGTAQTVATTNQVYHDTVAAFNDKYSELQRDIAGLAVGQANLLAKENECCCSTLRAIDSVNYNTTTQIQKVLDAMAQSKIEALQAKVNSLELKQALTGVVRYPLSASYAYDPIFTNNGGTTTS